MVQQTVVAVLCDVCGAKGADPYRIGFQPQGAPRRFDLCKEHAAPLWEIKQEVESRQPPPSPDRRRRQPRVVPRPAETKKKARSSK